MPRKTWGGPTADEIARTLVNQAWWTGETKRLRIWAKGAPSLGFQKFRHDALAILAEAFPAADVIRLAELCGVIPEL